MTVDNVKSLTPFAVAQGGKTSAKPEEIAQETFDKLITKMSGELADMGRPKASLEKAQLPEQAKPLQQAAPEKPQEKAAETVAPKDEGERQAAEQAAAKPAGEEQTKAPEDAAEVAEGQISQDGEKEPTVPMEGEAAAPVDAKTEAALEEAAIQLMQEIAQVMQVPLEEVQEAMESLELTEVDLLEPANLKQVLLQLVEDGDAFTLVTDGTLYGNLQELTGALEETLGALQEELSLNPEELEALVQKLSELKREPVQSQKVPQQPQTAQPQEEQALQAPVQTEETEEPLPEGKGQTTATAQEAEEQQPRLAGMKDYAVTVEKGGQTVQVKVTVDDQSGEKRVSEQVTEAKDQTPDVAQAVKRAQQQDKNPKQEHSQSGQQAAGNTFFQRLGAQIAEAQAQAQAERPVYTPQEQSQIMNQIVDYMKATIRPDTQQMEMQLHPASLGTVRVQIAAKDGVVTAQFTAQNETVKAVLETQMVQLKEQFEEQGIKVGAVEVTVANHSYGQQSESNQEAAGQGREGAKKGMRRINLEELAEEGLEELADSERIAVEMMQASGSTVDYTA